MTKFLSNVQIDLSLCEAAEDDPEAFFDALKSFPSGHAQISSYTASFLAVRQTCSINF